MPAASYHPDRIAKNTSYMTIALVIQKVLSFAYFAYISRAVGHVDIGRYLYALALGTVFGIFIDFGLSPVITRETAKQPEQGNRFLNAVLTAKLIASVFVYIALIGTAMMLGEPALSQKLIALAGIIMVLDTFTLSFYATLRGSQVLKYEAIGTIINKLLVIALGVIGIEVFHFGIRWLMAAILGGSIFNFAFSSYMLAKMKGWRPRIRFDGEIFKILFRIAVPFALANIFVTIYSQVDSILLKNLSGDRGEAFVGWYGTAYKLTFALQFIPIAVAAAIFPAMSAYFNASKELLVKTFERALFYLLVLAVPLSVGIAVLADTIILSIWGTDFEASITPLRFLIVSLLFVFLNFPVGSLLNATNRQAKNTRNIGIVMVVSIALNLIVIPKYGFVGASVVSLCTAALWFIIGICTIWRVIHFNARFLFITFAKIILASAAMGGLMIALKSSVHLLALIPIGVVAYFGILVIVRGFGARDFRTIQNAMRRRMRQP